MSDNKYMNQSGLAFLWSRIQQLVYECATKNIVTYRLTSDGNTVTLVGSDGSKSSVTISATAECEE